MSGAERSSSSSSGRRRARSKEPPRKKERGEEERQRQRDRKSTHADWGGSELRIVTGARGWGGVEMATGR